MCRTRKNTSSVFLGTNQKASEAKICHFLTVKGAILRHIIILNKVDRTITIIATFSAAAKVSEY